MPPDTTDLVDALTTDTTRKPFERETRLLWSAESDRVNVHTAERALMNRLLNHPEFEVRWFAARGGDRGEKVFRTCSTHGSEPNAADWSGEPIVSMSGALPLACVLVKEHPRTSGTHADVVTSGVLR